MSLDTRRTRNGALCVSTARSAHARQGRRRSVGTTTRSRPGARSASPAAAQTEPSRRCDEEGKRRGDVTRHTAHAKRRALCVDGTIGARTTRSAALGRHDDSLAARRSLGVAGVGSDRAEPAMRRGARGAVMSLDTRRTRNGALRVSTARSAHARQGRRRSVGTTTRSRPGARSASPVAALTEPSRRCDEEQEAR